MPPAIPVTGFLPRLRGAGPVITVRPSGPGASGSKRRPGRPFIHAAPRARVSTWPPLRLTRMRLERESVVVVCPPVLPLIVSIEEGRAVPRRIGLDVHREFAQIAVWEDGLVGQAGQIATTPEALRAFADSLLASDEVAIEATCNTHAIVKLIAPRVARVVISNPMKTRAIAEARVKTDKVDAKILAQLLAADYCRRCGSPMSRRRRCGVRSRVARTSSASARG